MIHLRIIGSFTISHKTVSYYFFVTEKREKFDRGEDPLDPENPHNHQQGFNPFQQFHGFHGSQFKFHFN